MARLTKVTYICGKEVEAETDLRKEKVPCYGEGTYFTTADVEMCGVCSCSEK